MKTSKGLTVLLTTLALSLTGLTSAQATEPSMNLEQFLVSENYSDMAAAEKASNDLVALAGGVELELTEDIEIALLGGKMRALAMSIAATKTSAKVTMTSLDSTMEFYASGGKNYSPVSMVCIQTTELIGYADCTGSKYLTEMKSRLGKKNLGYIQQDSSSANPDSNFSAFSPWRYTDREELMNQFKLGVLGSSKFGAITKNITEGETIYSYTVSASDEEAGVTHNLTVTERFDSNGILGSISIVDDMKSMILSGKVEIAMTQKINNEITVTVPSEDAWVTEAVFNSANRKYAGELKLLAVAKSIVSKAGTAAKKAKKSLSSSHLVTAAKSLKQKPVSIPNGIKLSTKVSGVSSSVCIVISKGKASTKTC